MNRLQKEQFIRRAEKMLTDGKKMYVDERPITAVDIARWKFSLVYDDLAAAAEYTLKQMDDIISDQAVQSLLGTQDQFDELTSTQAMTDLEQLLKKITSRDGFLNEYERMAIELDEAIRENT